MKSNPSLLASVVLAASMVFSAQQIFADETSAKDQAVVAAAEAKPCHWFQFGHCDKTPQVEGLPPEAPLTGTLVTVDVATNRIYLFQDGKLVDKTIVATGSEKVLRKGTRTWLFRTPRGRMKVLRKIEDPVWTKPDWAFVEDGEKIPPPNSSKRLVKGHLGKYALDLGDGIMIHGTDDPSSFGKRVSHGCIRVPADMLKTVWDAAPVGTEVFIFESGPVPEQIAGKREIHSDLDF